MSPVQNCLNRYLLFPNICGSFLFNLNGQLIHTRVIRIILSLVSYAYCLYFYERVPSTINFHFLIRIIQNFLICSVTGMLLRPSWLKQDFRKSLELIERLSGFVNGTEIKLSFWPSIVSNVVIFSAVSYKAYKFSIPIFFSLSHLYILLLLNAFTDEFSTILLLLRFLSEALNTQLTTVINRESLISMLKAHNMLCLAVGHINNLYSVQILLSVALSFICCILFTHVLIKEILLAQIDSFTLFLWIFGYLQLSVKIILSASALANSMQNFDVHLYEILKNRPPSWTQLVSFGHSSQITVEDLMFDRSVRFTAAGFFDLSIENLGSMISVATTYLVLLIQMN